MKKPYKTSGNVVRAKKFGAFSGVFTPSILTILGVIMFLRLPWIVGQAGLWSTLGIILVAHIISVSTGLSVASVATDKRVGAGGGYYIISRSLGLPIGGTLGLALFVGLSFSISLYLIGFAEIFLSYFGFEVSLYTIRIAGSVTLFLVAVVTFISTSLAIKTQYLIMTAMVLSLLSVFLGRHEFMPSEPLMMPLSGALPWITLFAIFFPAVTGFMAGVSMSGDLRDPRKNIPFGTITAILVGLLVYVSLALFLSFTVDRDLLVGDPQVLFNIAWLPQLVIAGVLGATLSSALGSILGAPRIFQSMAIDRILPSFFAKGFGPSNEPRNALILTYIIAQAGILIGELNVIARIVTIFFIITYGFLNITYAVESWAGTDFRPTFKIPGFVSIIGALACIIVMIQLDIIALVVASVVLIALFLFLKKRELTLQTGDTWNSIWTSLVKTGLGRLTLSSRKPSNWRPNVLLFSGGEANRPHLLEMGKSLVGKLGIFTNFELTEEPNSDNLFRKASDPFVLKPGSKPGVFTRYHECRNIYEGIDVISKIYGFSGFEPNTILMGWARNTRNPVKFAELLSSFKKQDYNAVFLSYNKEAGFGRFRKVDVWWSGRGRNLSLAITLLKFLTSSKEWRGAELRILTINKNTAITESLYSLVDQVLNNQRIRATVKVINNSVEQLPENDIIHAESRQADLCVMELPNFKGQEPGKLIEQVNRQTETLGSCLVISASGFFDELMVIERKPLRDRVDDAAFAKRPRADILPQLIPASKEILTNEVYNIATKTQSLSVAYFEHGIEAIVDRQVAFLPEIGFFAEKILGNLEGIMERIKPSEKDKTLLKLLNDFSYHSQRQIQQLKEVVLPGAQEVLENATNAYISGLQQAMVEVPEKTRIRLESNEFRIDKDDRFFARAYKYRKKLLATITRKPVLHKIYLLPAVRYFVFYRRLDMMLSLMNEYAAHSFQQITEVRKVLISIHEVIEKARRDVAGKQSIPEYIRLERQRLKARIAVMHDENMQFGYATGHKVYQLLLEDLNQLSAHLQSTQANSLSKNFKVWFRQEKTMIDALQGFSGLLKNNLDLFVNKTTLDFFVLAIKSRIHAKTMKYHQEFSSLVKGSLLDVIKSYRSLTFEEKSDIKELERQFEKLDHSRLMVPPANETYENLFEEVRDLLREVPEKIDIGGEHFIEHITGMEYPDPEPVVVHLRKVLSLYLGKDFIDPSRKTILETDQQIQRTIAAVKDLVRLMNFSLVNDEGVDADNNQVKKAEQRAFLIRNFHRSLKEEEGLVLNTIKNLERSFANLLTNAFEPLSSATIGKSGSAVAKHKKNGNRGFVFEHAAKKWNGLTGFLQQQSVNLLYSKSEGMNWFRHLEKSSVEKSLSHRDTLDFVEAITPLPAIMNVLPFYYCSLFSGQAGIGDDFWVGMKDQIREADQAIRRFKAGHSGALLVTGARSSGKTSLSKMVARKHFPSEHIHQVRAPQGCTADLSLFTTRLLESLHATNTNLEDVFKALPAGKTILVQDLALWWERKPGGNAVVECIKSLIDLYGDKCLFIITVNSHALPLIDHWCKLKSFALTTIVCEPFDARELKELIMLRHYAGGLNIHYNKNPEDRMTAWDYARLFNAIFDHSFGNPGTAILLWLASIKKVSGKTIYLETPSLPPTDVFDKLTRDQWFYILQFLVHRRFTIDALAENMAIDRDKVYADIRELMRAGLLAERFQGVYAISPGMDLYLTEKIKTLKRL